MNVEIATQKVTKTIELEEQCYVLRLSKNEARALRAFVNRLRPCDYEARGGNRADIKVNHTTIDEVVYTALSHSAGVPGFIGDM